MHQVVNCSIFKFLGKTIYEQPIKISKRCVNLMRLSPLNFSFNRLGEFKVGGISPIFLEDYPCFNISPKMIKHKLFYKQHQVEIEKSSKS